MLRKLSLAVVTCVALSGCGPSLWALQDACRAGDQGSCEVAQQRLQMLGMSTSMGTASAGILANSGYRQYVPAPVSCANYAGRVVCQ